eukprot:751917-Hanusia_phi.AAC.5
MVKISTSTVFCLPCSSTPRSLENPCLLALIQSQDPQIQFRLPAKLPQPQGLKPSFPVLDSRSLPAPCLPSGMTGLSVDCGIIAIAQLFSLLLPQCAQREKNGLCPPCWLRQGATHTSSHPARSLRLRGGEESEFDAASFLSSYGIPRNLSHLEVTFHAETGAVHLAEEVLMEFDTSDWWLQRQPRVSWEGKGTLLMLDPDAPQPNTNLSLPGRLGPWLHWLVVDAQDQPESGRSLVEYMGPAPPMGECH